MLDNPSPYQTATLDSYTAGTVGAAKRYTPPNQRNRSNNRPKPTSTEMSQGASSRNVLMDLGDAGSSGFLNQYSGVVALQGCSNSAASRLLHDRWNAAVQLYNSSSMGSPDKPVMHLGGTEAWSNFRLPHQIMAPPGSSSGMQVDFLVELNRAMLSFST